MMPAAARVDVRRLAALDMHGTRGSRRRRRLILVEFSLGTVGGAGLGVWALSWSGVDGVVLGVWLLGLATNYLALTAHVLSLWHPRRLAAELAGIDLRAELRHYTKAQIWVLVPFLIAGIAVAQARQAS
jgi:hypothetical protein